MALKCQKAAITLNRYSRGNDDTCQGIYTYIPAHQKPRPWTAGDFKEAKSSLKMLTFLPRVELIREFVP